MFAVDSCASPAAWVVAGHNSGTEACRAVVRKMERDRPCTAAVGSWWRRPDGCMSERKMGSLAETESGNRVACCLQSRKRTMCWNRMTGSR
jgi:hypothetical protein